MDNKEEQDTLSQMLQEEHSCMPVFLSEEISDLHYNGFSNR
jgi:trehalose-6-phosphate synthase